MVLEAGFFFVAWDLSEVAPEPKCYWDVYAATTLDNDSIWAAVVAPDGRTLLTGHLNGAVSFWNISGTEAVEIEPLRPNPTSLSSGAAHGSYGPFVLDDLLLTSNEMARPSLWQIDDGRLVSRTAPADGDKPVAYLLGHSSDGRLLAARSSIYVPRNGVIFRRDGDRFEPVRDFTAAEYQSVALNHDGSKMVLAAGARLELWNFDGARSRKL
ncbi:MAG: hypothetical protein O3B13_25610, partial [Planctomycetota bacterium]|nr:hypothetical protein [Planctomycetota bacterium]